MNTDHHEPIKAADRLINEADLAYRFSAGSYSHAVLAGAMQMRAMLLNEPSWIKQYEDYGEYRPEMPSSLCLLIGSNRPAWARPL